MFFLACGGFLMFIQAGTCFLLALILLDANVAGGLELSLEPSPSTHDGLYLQCEELFSKLQGTPDGRLRQHSQLQLRGEPKSGTSFVYQWARRVLEHTCEHLQAMYGSESCRTENISEDGKHMAMIFEPSPTSTSLNLCACSSMLGRVEISVSTVGKHSLPVSDLCPWSHGYGIAREGDGCWSFHGQPVENEADVWTCMQETPCEMTDNRLQFVSIRDPRAVAVSTYFHHVHGNKPKNYLQLHPSLDETVLEILPQLCHLTTLRHIMFEGLLSDRSEMFWYEETVEDPFDWHYRWAAFAGLLLPRGWLDGMVAANQENTHLNPHPGGAEQSANRTWRDEVSPGIRQEMDSILRKWLPGVLLARYEIPP
ncbi:unnamed protein product [Ectocarpus sp. 12 AP-2014]